MKRWIFAAAAAVAALMAEGTSVEWYESADGDYFRRKKVKTATSASAGLTLPAITGSEEGTPFAHWGTTFNELDWDAFLALDRAEQDGLMHSLFAPDGDLRFTRGRIGMNCNDYGRSWFSCDEVPGDLELRYFNIERDKRGIIPLIRAAQHFNPSLTFWASPWSPPSWMKINGDYPVVSSRHNSADPRIDYLLFGATDSIDEDEMKFLGPRDGKFPRRLATTDYFIQDPRYLQAYADYFCRFIEEYAAQGVPIDMVIYQNEAYSYTPYPGCAWTAEGTIRFNRDYLGPTLKRRHPEVKLFIGTFNTNRLDHVERIMADSTLRSMLAGAAFQWEGREILPEIRRQYPALEYICSESECGNGSMDWAAAEHTFFLIADNLGNGCSEWYNWNFLLPRGGESPWGWRQNALVELDETARTVRYTPEFHAVKHFSHFIAPGARIVGYSKGGADLPVVLVARNADGTHVAVAANRSDAVEPLSLHVKGRHLAVDLAPHSMSTFIFK